MRRLAVILSLLALFSTTHADTIAVIGTGNVGGEREAFDYYLRKN